MVLGKLPVPGRPTIWITVGQGPTALAVSAGGVVWTFLLSSLSPLSPRLWETARYRLKYCLKGPLNPKPTNQPTIKKTSWTIHQAKNWKLAVYRNRPILILLPSPLPTTTTVTFACILQGCLIFSSAARNEIRI